MAELSQDINKLRAQRAGIQMGQAVLQAAALQQGVSRFYLEAVYKIIHDALRTSTIKVQFPGMSANRATLESLRDINLKLKDKKGPSS